MHLKRYGCFEDTELALAAEPGRLNLIVAPNGMGKTVLRHAFHDLLFDIPKQSPMDFRFTYKGMELHADAVDAAGTPFGFGWIRNGKPERVSSDPARYAEMRRGISSEQLRGLFALDTAGLRRGGTDLKGGDTLSAALLSGTGELASASKVRAELERRRAENYAPSARKPPLNAALSELIAAQKAASQSVQRPQQREKKEAELEEARAALAAARERQARAAAEVRHLHRLLLLRPHLHSITEAEAWFAAHPDSPALPPGLDEQLAQARAGLATAQSLYLAAEEVCRGQQAALDAIVQDPLALQHGAALAVLAERLGEARAAHRDLPARQRERQQAEAQRDQILRDIGALGQDAAGLIPSVGVAAAARDAITQHALLRGTLAEEARRAQLAGLALAALQQSPAPASVAQDGLAALVAEIRQDRQPAQHAAECAAAVSQARAALSAGLAKVPGWTGDAASLRAVIPADDAVYERLDQARRDRASAASGIQQERDGVARQVAAAQGTLAALTVRPLPDAASILAARTLRDRGWSLIARRLDGDADPHGELDYAAGQGLALLFDRRLREADALADRRLDELARVQEAERLTSSLAVLAAERLRLDRAHEAAQAASAHAAADWTAAVAPAGLAPDASLAEVRRWHAARVRVVDALHALELAQDMERGVAQVQEAWARRLRAMLGETGGLAALLAVADAHLAAGREAAQAARDWNAAHTQAQEREAEAAASHRTAQRRLDDWRAGWTALLLDLGRPAGEAPPATAAVLDRLGQLDAHVRDVASLSDRITAMQSSLAAADADVRALSHALQDSAGPDMFQSAEMMIRRGQAAAQQASRAAQATGALAGARATLEAQAAALREAQDRLAAVIAMTGAPDASGAEQRIAAARTHAHQLQLHAAAMAAVREHGGGAPVPTLIVECAAVPDLAAALMLAEAEAEACGDAVEALAVAEAALSAAARAAADGTDMTEAAVSQAAAAAVYARRLEEQLVLHVASFMLRRAMQEVQDGAGGGALAQLSARFGAVTDGAYTLAEDEETGTLHAVEQRFPNEKKRLQQLSEGTRDQLYLALRIGALQDHARAQAPLPFVADDVLQTFDDGRAVASLRALLALSEVLQVIVLTHHDHLVRLTDALPAGSTNVLRLD